MGKHQSDQAFWSAGERQERIWDNTKILPENVGSGLIAHAP